jgi:hypothetical protein
MTVAEMKDKLAIIEAAAAARRAKFKIEFMLLCLNTGREKEAAKALTDGLIEINKIADMKEKV